MPKKPKDAKNAPRIPAPTPVPPSLLMPPGVVIVPPEQLTEVNSGQLPYEKADRTPAGPLQELEGFAAQHLLIEPDRLISLKGEVCELGSVVLFRVTTEPARDETEAFLVASYAPDAPDEPGNRRFRVAVRSGQSAAEDAYARRVAELQGGDSAAA